MRTTDGRTLAFAETGQPDGVPVFYFHGLPGSRNDFTMPFTREAVEGTGARVIGMDRPGFGASGFQPKRSYRDWPEDVARVADELGIATFAVLGYSAGGPYVAACAYTLAERLTFAGIVSGVGPTETPRFRHGMGKTDAIMTRLSRWAPALARLAISHAARMSATAPEKFSAQFDKELSPVDVTLHRDPVLRATVRTIFQEATRQGPAGVVLEYQLCGRTSGIRYNEITFPVQVWHGDSDAVVPVHHAEYVASTLANGKLVIMPGVGHLHTPQRWREFLSDAVATSRA